MLYTAATHYTFERKLGLQVNLTWFWPAGHSLW